MMKMRGLAIELFETPRFSSVPTFIRLPKATSRALIHLGLKEITGFDRCL